MATPETLGLGFQELWIDVPGKRKINGWFIPHPNAQATLLFFHGNAGNISHRLEKIKIFHDIGFATIMVDYAGYGKSEGSPSESVLYEDGLASYQYAIDELKINPKKLILYGESLGSAVAIDVLSRGNQAGGLVLEGGFASLKALAKTHFQMLAPIAGNKYNNLEKIKKVLAPVLIIHSKIDEICSFEQAQALLEAAPEPKQHLWFDRGGHNDGFWVNRDAYKKTLTLFSQSPKQ